MEHAHFICPACEKTEVYRPVKSERPAPKCASCDEGVGGCTEMVWIGDESRNS